MMWKLLRSEVIVLVLWVAAAALSVGACSEDVGYCCPSPSPPYPVEPPPTTLLIPSTQLWLGEAVSIDLTRHFDFSRRFRIGKQAEFRVESSSPETVGVSTSGDTLTIEGSALGWAGIRVAPYPGFTYQEFSVLVVPLSAPPNRGPMLVQHPVWFHSLLWEVRRVVQQQSTYRLDLYPYFRDPDGDHLTFSATVEKPETLSASVSGDTLILQGAVRGQSRVTVTATDSGGLFARGDLRVEVGG